MQTQEQWVEAMHLENLTQHFFGIPKDLGFTPNAEEVVFITSEPDPWLNDFLTRHLTEIDALFLKKYENHPTGRRYHFSYIPRMVQGMTAEMMEYNRPEMAYAMPAAEEIADATAWIYYQFYDKALTPLPHRPMLIRFKDDSWDYNENWYAHKQGREPNYIFSHAELPDTRNEENLMVFFADFIDSIGENHILFSLKQPSDKKDTADYYTHKRAQVLEEEIRERVAELRQLGVAELVINRLFQVPEPKPSRLTITQDFRLFLTDYGNREVKMTVLPKVLYFFYLNHPEGVLFKELSSHEKELLGYYKMLSNRLDFIKMHRSITDLVDSTKNSVNEKASLIRSAFLREFDVSVMNDYLLTADEDRRKRVLLDRQLVIDESGRILKAGIR